METIYQEVGMKKVYNEEFKKEIAKQVKLMNGDYRKVAQKEKLPKSTVWGWAYPEKVAEIRERRKARLRRAEQRKAKKHSVETKPQAKLPPFSIEPKMNIDLAVELCIAYKNNGISRELLKAMLPKALGV